MMNYYKFGLFRKNNTRPIIKTRTYQEAELLRKNNFIECEVRPL